MKRFIAFALILLLVLPSALPWLPHEVSQNIHHQMEDRHEAGHAIGHYSDHDSVAEFVTPDAHPHLDILSYFDLLHIDLQKVDYAKLTTPSSQAQDMPFIMETASYVPAVSFPLIRQSQGPPDRYLRSASLGVPPLYLTTQRLRI
jgi:hypothetical protein